MTTATNRMFGPAPPFVPVAHLQYGSFRAACNVMQYVRDNGFNQYTTATTDSEGRPTCSHYSYCGGPMACLQVPQNATPQFAANIRADFVNGRFHCFTEVRPPGAMRFYLDVDVKAAALPTDEDWVAAERAIMTELQKFYTCYDPGSGATTLMPLSDPLFTALVLASGSRVEVTTTAATTPAAAATATEGGSGSGGGGAADSTPYFLDTVMRAGVHVVFQNLFVTVPQAVQLGSAIKLAVAKVCAALDVDVGVYANTRGLRWAWQFKAMECGNCARLNSGAFGGGSSRGGRKAGCDECISGMVANLNSSMYAPTHFLHGDGTHEDLPSTLRANPTVELLLASSIRAVLHPEPTPGYRVYDGAPPPLTVTVVDKRRNTVRVTDDGGSSKHNGGRNFLEVNKKSLAYHVLERIVRDYHKPKYSGLDISRVWRTSSKKDPAYIVKVTGYGAKSCLNKGSDHRTSRVWFHVSKNQGVVLRCYCERCKDFRGVPEMLTTDDEVMLFPEDETDARNVGTDALLTGMDFGAAEAAAAEADAAATDPVLATAMRDCARAEAQLNDKGLPVSAAAMTANDRMRVITHGIVRSQAAPVGFGGPCRKKIRLADDCDA